MSIPMICAAALRASSAVFASLMPPALPRPPTGPCACTGTGPSLEKAAACAAGLRATSSGGIGMPREARISLAWYSRSFKSGRGGVKRAGEVLAVVAALPSVAERALDVGVVEHQHGQADAQYDHNHAAET